MTGKTFVGERCFLHCASGYKPAGRRMSVCTIDLRWKPRRELKCVPFAKPRIQHRKIYLKEKQKRHDTILAKIDKLITNAQQRHHPGRNNELFLVCDGKSPERIQPYPVIILHFQLRIHNKISFYFYPKY
jgi:hypothetical protein